MNLKDKISLIIETRVVQPLVVSLKTLAANHEK